jgi:hypothetical protein
MATIDRLLDQHGFQLARSRKHRVYKNADGTTFVTASTPSDWRAERNSISDFAKLLGKSIGELTAPAKPKRAARHHSRLEPVTMPEPTPTPIGAPAPPPDIKLERQIRMLEKRQRKYDATKAVKLAKKIERLMWFVNKAHELYVERVEVDRENAQWRVAITLTYVLRKMGDPDVEAVVCSSVTDPDAVNERGVIGFAAVRVGSLYLDFLTRAIHKTGRWTVEYDNNGETGVDTFEAVISLEELARAK